MKNKVTFSALGGLGEIGLNSYVYTVANENQKELNQKEHLIVDLGLGFKDTRVTSIDTFFPDISYFIKNEIKPNAIVITHGHEDHIGGLPYLMPYLLDCPIYATAWTLDLIREKLKEHKLDTKVKLIAVDYNKEYEIGSFMVKWVPTYHSIIDCSLLLISTPIGKIAHTGDFKTKPSDSVMVENLKKIAEEKPYYLVCDSTNVLEKGISGEELETKEGLKNIIASAQGASWIGMFSSNLERIRIIMDIAKELKKRIVLYGRSLNTYTSLAIKHGFLDSNFFVTEEESKSIDRDKLIILATGSQGEDRSVLYNVIIKDEYKERLRDKDIVIFASKVIPGNEVKINKYYNILADRNIKYYTAKDYKIHVSGHAKEDDLIAMYSYIKPKCIIPMHGETIHLKYHAEFAKSLGYESEAFHCGEVVELFNGHPHIVDHMQVGKLVQEGGRVVSFDEDFIKQRTKMFFEGSVFMSLKLDSKKQIENVELDIIGLLTQDEMEDYKSRIIGKLYDMLPTMLDKSYEDTYEDIRRLLRRIFRDSIDKKPLITIHLSM